MSHPKQPSGVQDIGTVDGWIEKRKTGVVRSSRLGSLEEPHHSDETDIGGLTTPVIRPAASRNWARRGTVTLIPAKRKFPASSNNNCN